MPSRRWRGAQQKSSPAKRNNSASRMFTRSRYVKSSLIFDDRRSPFRKYFRYRCFLWKAQMSPMDRGTFGGWLSGAGWTKEAGQKPVARISPRLWVLNNYYFESESVTAAPAFPVIRNLSTIVVLRLSQLKREGKFVKDQTYLDSFDCFSQVSTNLTPKARYVLLYRIISWLASVGQTV